MAQGLEFDDISMRSDTALRTPVLPHTGRPPREGSVRRHRDRRFRRPERFQGGGSDARFERDIQRRLPRLLPGTREERCPSSSPTFVKRLDIKVWRADAAVMQRGGNRHGTDVHDRRILPSTEGIARPAAAPAPAGPPPLPPELRPHPIPRVTPPRPARPTMRPIQKATTSDA